MIRMATDIALLPDEAMTNLAIDIEKTRELQTLHERVMSRMEPFFRQDATAGMFCDDAVAETTLDWVRSYHEKAGYERFSPHITLGYGLAKAPFSSPVVFAASELALCHLGNHCTCRKVLVEVRLE